MIFYYYFYYNTENVFKNTQILNTIFKLLKQYKSPNSQTNFHLHIKQQYGTAIKSDISQLSIDITQLNIINLEKETGLKFLAQVNIFELQKQQQQKILLMSFWNPNWIKFLL